MHETRQNTNMHTHRTKHAGLAHSVSHLYASREIHIQHIRGHELRLSDLPRITGCWAGAGIQICSPVPKSSAPAIRPHLFLLHMHICMVPVCKGVPTAYWSTTLVASISDALCVWVPGAVCCFVRQCATVCRPSSTSMCSVYFCAACGLACVTLQLLAVSFLVWGGCYHHLAPGEVDAGVTL